MAMTLSGLAALKFDNTSSPRATAKVEASSKPKNTRRKQGMAPDSIKIIARANEKGRFISTIVNAYLTHFTSVGG